jgi:hypothetical protein
MKCVSEHSLISDQRFIMFVRSLSQGGLSFTQNERGCFNFRSCLESANLLSKLKRHSNVDVDH